MNVLEQFHDDEQRVLDRLVDDELSDTQRRELLAGLDDEPGAWRRCALTFIESQRWGRDLSQPFAKCIAVDGHGTAAVLPASRRSRGTLGAMCLAVAASILLAFGLGTRFSPSADQSKPLAVLPPSTEKVAAQGLAPRTFDAPVADILSPEDGDLAEPAWETLTVTLENDNDNDQLELRIANASDRGDAWSDSDQSALPAQLLRQLEAAGLKVSRQQRWLNVDLSDGRQMVVPVEEVNIAYPEVAQN